MLITLTALDRTADGSRHARSPTKRRGDCAANDLRLQWGFFVPSVTSSQNASAGVAALTSDKVRAWGWKPHLLPAPKIVLLWLVGVAADNGSLMPAREKSARAPILWSACCPWFAGSTTWYQQLVVCRRAATIARRPSASSASGERNARRSAGRSRSARAALTLSTGLAPDKQKRWYAPPAKGPLLITQRSGDPQRFARRALQVSATG